MSNPTWPAGLPSPSDDQGTYAPLIANVITSQIETGAPKRRRRFTYMPETYKGQVLLTAAQCATLDTFVVTTLKDVNPFDWKDFRSGNTATYVFNSRPTYTRVPNSKGYWNASLDLLKITS